MSNDDLINFIKQSKSSGQTDEQIKSSLRSAGWQEGDIEEGLKTLVSSAPSVPRTPASQSKPVQSYSDILYGEKTGIAAEVTEQKTGSSKKSILVVIIILFLLAAAAAAYFYKDELVNLPVIKDFVSKNDNENKVVITPASQPPQ